MRAFGPLSTQWPLFTIKFKWFSYTNIISRRISDSKPSLRILSQELQRNQSPRVRFDKERNNTRAQFLHDVKSRTIDAQQRRDIHFLPLLGLWGAKHVSAWTLYNACKQYGWSKVYRRLLEQNRSINANNPSLQASTRRLIKLAIVAPPQFASQLGQQAQVIATFLQNAAAHAEPNMPTFLVVAIKFIINSQKPVKILQDLVGAASKHKVKN
mmetsp:Transcript_20162/g.30319  ORF Transcript_20162/g.30319 Transcript_20162/m.30319 type:complete len:212 (-) Transcript_20162:1269-1904(-)